MRNDHKVDLFNINANTKYVEILSMCSQDIKQKRNCDGWNDGHNDGRNDGRMELRKAQIPKTHFFEARLCLNTHSNSENANCIGSNYSSISSSLSYQDSVNCTRYSKSVTRHYSNR